MSIHYHDDRSGPEPGSSHALAISCIPAGAHCLELGCSTGYMGAWLRKLRGCSVTGVEINPVAAGVAAKALDEVIVGSLEDANVWNELRRRGPFDVVLAASVLEHLVDPSDALAQCRAILGNNGRLVCTVPNIAHWSVRMMLLRGRWTYSDYGLLDRTHMRFWSAQGIRKLLLDSGFAPAAVMWTWGYSPVTVRRVRDLIPVGSGVWPELDHVLENLMGYELVIRSSIGT